MTERRTTHFRFALGARVMWLGTVFVVDRRRWEERRVLGPVVKYGLVDVHAPGLVVVWAEEADLRAEDELPGMRRDEERSVGGPGAGL